MNDGLTKSWPGLFGEMPERFRAQNWAATPLGAIESWPQNLRVVVDLMLCSAQPVYIAFGPSLTSLYNDGYIPILGAKHPDALGRPYAQVWPEIMAQSEPLLQAVMSGKAQHFVDHPVPLAGRDGLFMSWFTFSWTPLRDDGGAVQGFYCSATETTAQVLAQAALRESDELLRLALEGADAVPWRWDLQTNGMLGAPESYRRFGREPPAAKPYTFKDWIECLHPEDRARTEKDVFDALEKRAVEHKAEYRVIRASGEVRSLYALGKVEYAADGSPLRMSGITLDITERKRAEEVARKAEEREREKREELETILATLPIPVVIARDAACVEVTGNRAAYEFAKLPFGTNFSIEASAEQPLRDFGLLKNGRRLPPSEMPLPRAVANVAIAGEEVELRSADGSSKFLLCNASPLLDSAGNVRGAVSAYADITELKRSEAALRDSEERLRIALIAAKAGAWEVALDTGEVIASDRARALGGAPPGAVPIVEDPWACVHPEDRPRLEKAHQETLRTGNCIPSEWRVLLPDGSVRWVEARGDRQSTPEQVVSGLVLDVTDRKRAEIALREHEARLRSIIETAADSIIVIDDKGMLQSANGSTASLFGYSIDELVGRHFGVLMLPDVAARHDRYLKGFPGKAAVRQIEGRRKDGSLVPVDVAVSAWRDDEGKRFFTGVLRDISERKRHEEALADARRREAVGRLAGGVAHDFNNLLHVISGCLEIARDRVLDEATGDLLQQAHSAAEKGSALNQRLLSLARKRSLKPEYLNLNERIEQTAKLLASTVGEHITVTTNLEAGIWMTLVDSGEVDSAVLNLSANARDAMPDGGNLRISTSNVTFDEQAVSKLSVDARGGDYVCLEVADDGVGMTEDVLHQATEPFFTTKGPGAGTGLGLASVASFARQAGGFMSIASAAREGCAVRVYLPCKISRTVERTVRLDDCPLGRGQLILVVEDNDQVRELTLRRLEGLGYAVIEARTGGEALEQLERQEAVQLVLSDVVMPGGMSGYDLARWVAANKQNIKVIICSGYAEKDRNGGSKNDIGDLIALDKPYNRGQLARAVNSALAR
jgi:PAS domain S-box-containing protein